MHKTDSIMTYILPMDQFSEAVDETGVGNFKQSSSEFHPQCQLPSKI